MSHDTTAEPNVGSSSTKWAWKRVILTGRPAPSGSASNGRTSQPPLRARDPRKPITIQLEYRGGPEAKWRATARERSWIFPGVTALHDVMRAINATL